MIGERSVLEAAWQAVIDEHGPWSAHNLHLGDGIYTISADIVGDEVKLARNRPDGAGYSKGTSR